MMKQNYYDRLEREQLVEDVADLVLSRLSATIDVEEIIKAIKEIDDLLNGLGR